MIPIHQYREKSEQDYIDEIKALKTENTKMAKGMHHLAQRKALDMLSNKIKRPNLEEIMFHVPLLIEYCRVNRIRSQSVAIMFMISIVGKSTIKGLYKFGNRCPTRSRNNMRDLVRRGYLGQLETEKEKCYVYFLTLKGNKFIEDYRVHHKRMVQQLITSYDFRKNAKDWVE